MAAIETLSHKLRKRERFDRLYSELYTERSSFIPVWRDIADNILPYRLRLSTSEANRGQRKNTKIIDSTGTLALRTLRAGMMGGITSPARPWFRLTVDDQDLAEFPSAKDWLDVVTKRMSTTFLRSNLYNVLPICYGDVGGFGTAAILQEEDFESLTRFSALPLGSYMVAVDMKGRVNTFMREYSQTVRQVVEKFGQISPESGKVNWENISTHVKNLWDQGNYTVRIDITHVILPNPDWDPRRLESKYKKYLSCYYESGGVRPGLGQSSGYMSSDNDRGRFLREEGYDYFPVLAPRWEVTADDAYGSSCPGVDALGDVRQLHQGERRIQEAIEKVIRPPMKGPSTLLNRDKSILPGGFTADDSVDGTRGFSTVYEIDPRINEMEMKQEQARERIKRAFFEDLFLMMAYTDRRQITAREIEERHEEKLIALGPVLEQLNQDLLDPLIDNTFGFMVTNKQIPTPPEELQGLPLKVEYVSVMAQAQKGIALGGLERYTGFLTNLAPVFPQVLHKLNVDALADEYADGVGISPKINRSNEEATELREQEAQAMQAQAQLQTLRESAAAAKDMSQASTEEGSVLSELMGAQEQVAV